MNEKKQVRIAFVGIKIHAERGLYHSFTHNVDGNAQAPIRWLETLVGAKNAGHRVKWLLKLFDVNKNRNGWTVFVTSSGTEFMNMCSGSGVAICAGSDQYMWVPGED
jgi:hypothetical protein